MAVDPSIPLRALTQTGPPVEGPLDQYTKGLNLQNLMRQGQMGQLQLTEAQSQVKEQDAVKQIFSQGLSPADTLKQLYTVSPSYAAQYQKAVADAQKSSADLSKTTSEVDAKQAEALGGIFKPVDDAPDPQQKAAAFQAAIANAKQRGLHGPDWPQAYSPQLDPVIHGLVMGGMSATQQGEASDRAARTKVEQTNSDLAKSKFDSEQAQAAAGVMIPGSEFINKNQQRTAMFKVLQPDGKTYKTEMRVLGEQGAVPRAPVPGTDVPYSPDVQNQKVAIAGAQATARADANAKAANAPVDIAPDSKEFKIAQDLAYGKLSFADFKSLYGRAAAQTNVRTALYEKARELNPEFNPAAFEMGYKFASNPKTQQQLASIDNVQQALPDLLKASDAATRTGVTTLNDLIIKGGIALGSKNYSNLAIARTAFADELSGALGFGGATDMAKQMGFDMTRTDLSPEAFRSGMKDIVEPFIERKRNSLLKPMGVYGQPGMNPAAPAATPGAPRPMSEDLIQRNMQANPTASRQQVIDALKQKGYQPQQ